MANQVHLPVNAEKITIVGGATSRPAAKFVDGVATGEVVTRAGRAVHRLRGATAFLDGSALEGMTIETATDFGETDIPAGSVLVGDGTAELTVRADARPGFNGGAPRGEIAGKLWVENLRPAGAIADLVSQAARRQAKEAS
ncbi:hypothetical protein [Microbacterium amylolyticum]|uniref:Uncharacterized protein n=1 Tax=Microbacterium amylolyticum TaxID=936337 RepID=A0ABS4ZIY1_9MICO|nr:hypothetical protein [Microbacterium amylolyticum]MBP2437248.1 hypothetical protein [Microbacterium amylolyticum]